VIDRQAARDDAVVGNDSWWIHVKLIMMMMMMMMMMMDYINVRPKADEASLVCRTEPNKKE